MIETKEMKPLYSIVLFFFFLGLSGCDGSRVFEEKITFSNLYWHKDNVATFNFEIEDTDAAYNLFYTIRNSSTYPYYNLYVNYDLRDSVGQAVKQDLQEMVLFDSKTGKPKGSGSGDLFDHKIPVLENLRFENKGAYRLKLTQYMRLDSLPDIASIGLRIEKAD